MGPETYPSWLIWALLSAAFAALTAIFAKVGVEDINSDLATLIRTVVVLISLSLILFATGQFSQTGADLDQELDFPGVVRARHRRIVDLLFPRAEARPGDAGGADRQIERRAGGAVRRGLSRRTAVA